MMDGLWFSIKLSLVTSTITAVLGMLVAIPSAYVLSRYRFRLFSFIDTVIDLPIVVPPLDRRLGLAHILHALTRRQHDKRHH